MAAVKRFFFDGENIREEKAPKAGRAEKQTMHGAGETAAGGGAKSGEMRMFVSSLLEKNGKRYARVSFVRGEDTAEGIVPDCRLEHVRGFTEEEEEAGLKFYLAANKDTIMAQARQIDPLTNWLRM